MPAPIIYICWFKMFKVSLLEDGIMILYFFKGVNNAGFENKGR